MQIFILGHRPRIWGCASSEFSSPPLRIIVYSREACSSRVLTHSSLGKLTGEGLHIEDSDGNAGPGGHWNHISCGLEKKYINRSNCISVCCMQNCSPEVYIRFKLLLNNVSLFTKCCHLGGDLKDESCTEGEGLHNLFLRFLLKTIHPPAAFQPSRRRVIDLQVGPRVINIK